MSSTIKRLFRKFTRGGGSAPDAQGRQQAVASAFRAGPKAADKPESSRAMGSLQLEPPVHEEESFEATLWRLLMNFPTRWTQLDAPDTTAAENAAFHRLILAGLVDVRLRVLARGLPNEPEVEATVFVTGDYTKKVADEVRSMVPEFSGQVIAKPQLPAEYRLNEIGLKIRQECRQFGGEPVEEKFLADNLKFTIPGVAGVLALRYIKRGSAPVGPKLSASDNNPTTMTPVTTGFVTTAPTTAASATATSTVAVSVATTPTTAAPIATVPAATTPAVVAVAIAASAVGKKSSALAAWPVAKTEGHVAAYLAQMKNLYIKMARDVLDGMTGAIETFRKTFGSTVIAEAITRKVGIKTKRACNKKDVDKTHAYRSRVQPLLRTPPEFPDGWEEIRASQHGEGIDELAAGIPFAKDNSPLDDMDEWEMLPEEENT